MDVQRCDHRDDFVIPEKLIDNKPDASSIIGGLPTEIIISIFSHLNNPDSISLALSCCRMIQVSALLHIQVPSVKHHRDNQIAACVEVSRLMRQIHPASIAAAAAAADDEEDHATKPASTRLCLDCMHWYDGTTDWWKAWEQEKEKEQEMFRHRSKNVVGHTSLVSRAWSPKRFSLQCSYCAAKDSAPEGMDLSN